MLTETTAIRRDIQTQEISPVQKLYARRSKDDYCLPGLYGLAALNVQ